MDLGSFDVSPERGFLPRRDPLATLPDRWPEVLNDLALALPKLLAARQLRAYVDALRESLGSSRGNRDLDELRSAARILSFAGHGYVWEDPHQPAAGTVRPVHLLLPRAPVHSRVEGQSDPAARRRVRRRGGLSGRPAALPRRDRGAKLHHSGSGCRVRGAPRRRPPAPVPGGDARLHAAPAPRVH